MPQLNNDFPSHTHTFSAIALASILNLEEDTSVVRTILSSIKLEYVLLISLVVCIVHSLLSIIQDGRTALMKASSEGHTEVVKVLAEAKADLNITNQVNLIILHSL